MDFNYYILLKKIVSYCWIKCQDCNFRKVIHVHHIDQDHNNNKLENLKLLCKPCHMNMHHPQKNHHGKTFRKQKLRKDMEEFWDKSSP